MSKISIVSNLQCTSIFTVRTDDDLVSVLAWEQGARCVQYNFHSLKGVRNQIAARARAGSMDCNLDAVMRQMSRVEVPLSERESFFQDVNDRIQGWVSDWFIANFDDVYAVGE